MNRKKLNNYKLVGSIHTLSVKSPGQVNSPLSLMECAYSAKKDSTASKINPNKLNGDIYAYSEFNDAMGFIMASAGIDEYKLTRVDMRYDSYEDDHYRRYAKLNRYLISLMAVQNSVKNCYRSTNLFTQKQISVAIKNTRMELENYDKDDESDGKDLVKSRLEERSKAWHDNDIKKEFTDHWFSRWDKALTDQNIKAVQDRYNDELERIYLEQKDSYPVRFRSLTDFLLQYQDCIFNRRQLIDLLSRFEEVQNPVNRAKKHKDKYGLEFFSKSDLQRAVNEIKRATTAFFDG